MITQEQIDSLFARIEAAYAKTGVYRMGGDWFGEEDDVVAAACPLGACLLADDMPKKDIGVHTAAMKLGLPFYFVEGFVNGYDGFSHLPPYDLEYQMEEYSQGHQAGEEARRRFPPET